MKLKRLKLLSAFRGLHEGFEMEFNFVEQNRKQPVSPVCFVGLNGSGKSNVLEVLAEIFYYLEIYHQAKREDIFAEEKGSRESQTFYSPFGFEISYILPIVTFKQQNIPWPELIEEWERSKVDPVFEIRKEKHQLPVIVAHINSKRILLENSDYNRNLAILPAHIVAYSSGMNELLSNPYIKLDLHYFDSINDKKRVMNRTDLNLNRFFYLNYDANKFITVCNWLFDFDGYPEKERKEKRALDFGAINLSELKNRLGINDLKKFRISLKLSKLKSEKEYLPLGLNTTLRDLEKCATFVNKIEKTNLKYEDQLEVDLFFWVNRATKEAFRHKFGRAVDLFRRFYFLNLLNIQHISESKRKAIAEAKAGSYENLSDELPKTEASQKTFNLSDITFTKRGAEVFYRKLSDGEHQLLHVINAILAMDTNGTLFLFDEPETHLNPDWRSKFIDLMNKSIHGNRKQEILLTTHSPYIVSDCRREQVYKFSRGRDGKVKTPLNPEINTFGASVHIISQEVFDKEETISELAQRTIEEIEKMPMDSRENIQKAKEASRVLGESPEKVLLFRKIIMKEEELKD